MQTTGLWERKVLMNKLMELSLRIVLLTFICSSLISLYFAARNRLVQINGSLLLMH